MEYRIRLAIDEVAVFDEGHEQVGTVDVTPDTYGYELTIYGDREDGFCLDEDDWEGLDAGIFVTDSLITVVGKDGNDLGSVAVESCDVIVVFKVDEDWEREGSSYEVYHELEPVDEDDL